MKTSKKLRITAAALAVAMAGAVTVYAAYDSTKDPIVSLSYLTDVFKPEVKSALKSELSADVNSAVASAKDSLKSELDSAVAAAKDSMKKDFDSAVAEAEAELLAKIEEDYSATIEALQSRLDALSNVYETVTLEKGKRLTANAACEIVLLSGSATVRSSATDSGLIDCTDGFVLYDGQNVPLNHKLLVPDNGDGRGITATGTAQLLVKGGYTVG